MLLISDACCDEGLAVIAACSQPTTPVCVCVCVIGCIVENQPLFFCGGSVCVTPRLCEADDISTDGPAEPNICPQTVVVKIRMQLFEL